jgi:WD40 repeat protein
MLNVCVSAEGKRLLTSSDDRTLRPWDAHTGEQLRVFEGHTASVNAAALSPDGKRVLSGGSDKTGPALAPPSTSAKRVSAASSAARLPRSPGRNDRSESRRTRLPLSGSYPATASFEAGRVRPDPGSSPPPVAEHGPFG